MAWRHAKTIQSLDAAGFESVRASGLLTIKNILEIQAELGKNDAGFRKLPGTALRDQSGRTTIVASMADLERFINDDTLSAADPDDRG